MNLIRTVAGWAVFCGIMIPPVIRAQTPPPQDVVIESVKLDMKSTDDLSMFLFTTNVVVTGKDLKLECDKLEVVMARGGSAVENKTSTLSKLGKFKKLIADGHVHLVQGDREALCGHAELLPDEDKVVLTENPVVTDKSNQGSVSGPRMVLYRGERRAIVEGDSTTPTRVILPAIKDLGFDPEKALPPIPKSNEPSK